MFSVSCFKFILLCFWTNKVFGGRTCMTPNEEAGTIVLIDNCKPLYELNQNQQKTEDEVTYLQQSIYSISNYRFYVCCPPKEKWNRSLEFTPIRYPDSELIKKNNQEAEESNELTEEALECTRTVTPPNVTTICCGKAQVILNLSNKGYVFDSGFPWLVLIEYSNGEQLCGGSLISSKFVLTAAHCFTSHNGVPEIVHLGSFDRNDPTKTKNTVSIPAETYYIHPKYDSQRRIHDIALIKLLDFAPFTLFITPICLPTIDAVVSGPPYPGNFAVAGWGSTENDDYSPVKLFVAVPYANHTICQKYHENTLLPEHICAGGGTGDSCGGDSGGPLEMFEDYVGKYTLAGLVSYGSKHCGQLGNPSVYTNVYKYKEWIYNVTGSL